MTMMIALQVFVLIHAPNGSEIMINPRQVTSLHAKLPDKPNEHFVDGVQCLINTADGKFVSVVEPCETVRRLLQQSRQPSKRVP